jgi:hypothetical protein
VHIQLPALVQSAVLLIFDLPLPVQQIPVLAMLPTRRFGPLTRKVTRFDDLFRFQTESVEVLSIKLGGQIDRREFVSFQTARSWTNRRSFPFHPTAGGEEDLFSCATTSTTTPSWPPEIASQLAVYSAVVYTERSLVEALGTAVCPTSASPALVRF